MPRARRSIWISLTLLAAIAVCAAIALVIAPLLTPERLKAEAEARLSEALKTHVDVGSVRLALGVGLHLEASDVRLWPGMRTHALRVGRVAIGLEPLSLLTGTLRPRRMVLERARFDIERRADGTWSAPFAFANERDLEGELERVESELRPLVAIEHAVRFLLRQPYLADALHVRSGEIGLRMMEGPGGSPPLVLTLSIDEGWLRHSRLRGDARLELAGRLRDPVRDLGPVKWTARRDRHGRIESQLDLSSVDAGTFESTLRMWDDRARLAGDVSGSVKLESREPGRSKLDVDLQVARFDAHILDDDPEDGAMKAPRVKLQIELDIAPDSVGVEHARIAAGELALEVSGRLARPLGRTAEAQLGLSLREIDLGELRSLLEWLPVREREPLEGAVASVVSGRLLHFETRGAATLGSWEAFFSGSRAPLAMGLDGRLEVADVVASVGDANRIENLSFRAAWSEDHLAVHDARGALNGSPLPVMQLDLDGLSHLLAAAPQRRQVRSGALPLDGVPALERMLDPDDGSDDEDLVPVVVGIDIDVLEHPIFVWPLERVHAIVETEPGGVRISLTDGIWAGVPITGEAEWLFRPGPEFRFSLAAAPAAPAELATDPPLLDSGWARGSFVMGPMRTDRWRHAGATGTFRAFSGNVRIEDLEVALDPNGLLHGTVSLNLAQRDEVPYQVSAALIGGDVSAIGRQLGLAGGLATGFVSAWASFDGTLREEMSPLADLHGMAQIEATQGEVWRKIPAIVAIALASKQFNSFSARDSIRYDTVETLLEFERGRVHTESFSLDGPDLRVFAEGSVDLARPPHEIDAEVALFLFRQLDRALDKIPILNLLLLGTRENLVAAHFELGGPWQDPESRLVPLKSLASGPASLVIEGLPNIIDKGLRALGDIFDDEEEESAADALSREPPAPPFES